MSAELQKNVILGNFARENLNPTGERKLMTFFQLQLNLKNLKKINRLF